jgi:hypothetical protein
MTVALTTRSREVPAAFRMADTFSRHCLVCSWIVSPKSSRLLDRAALCPRRTQDPLRVPLGCVSVAEPER